MLSKGNNPKPVSSNLLGQFKDEVVGEAKNIAKDTAKGVVSEPKKILESILGKPTTKKDKADGESGVEDLVGGGGGQQQANDPKKAAKQQQKIAMKMQADKQKAQKLLQLHRQRLKEEEEHFKMREQQEEQEKQVEEQQEEQEEKSEVMQLQQEKRKSEQLQRQTAGRMGSKEQGKGKKH